MILAIYGRSVTPYEHVLRAESSDERHFVGQVEAIGMASDYQAIKSENEKRYGTDIGRIGPLLLANRYDERTHFIYELLQNAEDALARRTSTEGPRSVEFTLSDSALRFSHYGASFSEQDVRSICGIADSTKKLTDIGRFGIGFKSVYALTECPEVHSGSEHFAIDSFVWPRSVPAIEAALGETVFQLPLRGTDGKALTEIKSKLQKLGCRTLLFLREIQEIKWSTPNGLSGIYTRVVPEELGTDVRKVVISAEVQSKTVIKESWVVFSRPVF